MTKQNATNSTESQTKTTTVESTSLTLNTKCCDSCVNAGETVSAKDAAIIMRELDAEISSAQNV